ncbi:MAG: DUF1697 domain-containing protein [Candidatus Kapabacteria bacterium]|nr:DUF1697 domain-containing protein [Candidatus Kapabacteria bacterium]
MTLIAFLRGINVGGNHKVPMADLRSKMTDWGYENVKTILNSGNVVFDCRQTKLPTIEATLEAQLSEAFGFPIPVILRTKDEIADLVRDNPFEKIEMHSDLRLYVSFLKTQPNVSISLPFISDDSSFQILAIRNCDIVSVLDVSKGKTVNGMNDLEKLFGKNITTRNWNTIIKVLQ